MSPHCPTEKTVSSGVQTQAQQIFRSANMGTMAQFTNLKSFFNKGKEYHLCLDSIQVNADKALGFH